MESKFSVSTMKKWSSQVLEGYFIFFLDLDCQNSECSLSTSAAYTRVLTVNHFGYFVVMYTWV